MYFDSYVGIDWSGDKNNFQKGISIALCEKGSAVPKIIRPDTRYWSRSMLLKWIFELISKKKALIGFDFSFSYPFYDKASYFPGIKDSPTGPYDLWKLINNLNKDKDNFYGGGIWKKNPFSQYYNAPRLKGTYYQSRRRKTEIHAKNKIHSPSPSFNCVGPGAVGTGSLSGMRFLHILKENLSIWPFENIIMRNKSISVEIFPTYYFRIAGVKPDKKIGYTLENINKALTFFETNNLSKNIKIEGPDQDDADAIISSAALRFFSRKDNYWNVPSVSKKEGWIFGV
ncbi:hypothetical protein N8801_02005 [Alphaproteobacteria bacterium]|nr:hypothetical protein [Alphaproteobacteria bacterium]